MLVILFTFLAMFGIGQALRGVKGDGEFKKGDFTLLDDHDIWPGSCSVSFRKWTRGGQKNT